MGYFLQIPLNAVLTAQQAMIIAGASVAAVILMSVGIYKFYPLISKLFVRNVSDDIAGFTKESNEEDLRKALATSGFAYDLAEDIFYSRRDAWQRDYGYCQLYDEAAPAMSMIVDCEPVRFEYGGKNWLIEFWKGQYGITTGAEIGVYYADGPDLHIPGIFDGTFYKAVEDKDMLKMAYTLKKNKKNYFFRYDRHWWLTGFRLGDFSEPEELTMISTIAFPDYEMCHAFVKALIELGYRSDEMVVGGRTVRFLFDKPKSGQPLTRTRLTDSLTQRKNKALVEEYNEIAKENMPTVERLRVIAAKSPELSDAVKRFGRTKENYKSYDAINKARKGE